MTTSGQHSTWNIRIPCNPLTLLEFYSNMSELSTKGGLVFILLPPSHGRRLLPYDRAPSEHNEQDVHLSQCVLVPHSLQQF